MGTSANMGNEKSWVSVVLFSEDKSKYAFKSPNQIINLRWPPPPIMTTSTECKIFIEMKYPQPPRPLDYGRVLALTEALSTLSQADSYSHYGTFG